MGEKPIVQIQLCIICVIFNWTNCVFLDPNISAIITNTDVLQLVTSYNELCPLTQLCRLRVPFFTSWLDVVNNTYNGPCCGDCRCSSNTDCLGSNECCPDDMRMLPQIRELRNILEDTTRCTQSQYNPHRILGSMVTAYNMVTICPLYYPDESIKMRCETGRGDFAMSGEDPSRLPPVSNNSTLTIYGNTYCAECHGENLELLALWDVVVTCTDNDDIIVNTIEDVDKEMEYKHCMFDYKPPLGGALYYYSKECDYNIDRCNVTGRWSQYDKLLETHCLSYTSVYKGYKNVHCYICNGNDISEKTEHVCVETAAYIYEVNFMATIDVKGLTKAYNERVNDNVQSPTSDAACGVDSRYDLYTNSCRRLLCPRMMYLHNGTCALFYTSAGPVCFHISLRLIPRNDRINMSAAVTLDTLIETKTMEKMSESREPVLHTLQTVMKLNKGTFEITTEAIDDLRVMFFDIQIHIYSNVSDLKYTLENSVGGLYDELANLDVIKEYAKEVVTGEHMFNTNISVKEPTFVHVVRPSIAALLGNSYEAADDDDGLALIRLKSMNSDLGCQTPVYVTPRQFCPKVMIESEHFVRQNNGYGARRLTLLEQDINPMDVVFFENYSKVLVCEDTYFDIVKKPMGAGQENGPTLSVSELKVNALLLTAAFCTIYL